MCLECIIENLPPAPVGRWSGILDTIHELSGKSAYVFRPPLTQAEVWSLRSSARFRGMTLYVQQHPCRLGRNARLIEATETRVWLKDRRR